MGQSGHDDDDGVCRGVQPLEDRALCGADGFVVLMPDASLPRWAWDIFKLATPVITSRSYNLALPPLPPSPDPAALMTSALFTLTDHLDPLLSNPRYRARGCGFAPQVLGQNA